MKSKFLLASLASVAVFALAMPAFSAESAQDFVNKAAIGGMFEVEFEQTCGRGRWQRGAGFCAEDDH